MVLGLFKNLGRYPAAYNEKVHGPYNPSLYYGKKDPLSEVKVGEIGAWIARRNKSPAALAGLFSRAYWRWNLKYASPKKAGPTVYFQFIIGSVLVFYLINYEHLKYHKSYRYHW
ncbi:hypothetical protein JTE90_013173 [Oedothorax gibbosus]|uniref:ATP synthase subunit f, mitochondrial n=1 Tax=Oedothorax gibbosus TaxID=931172 RepID=A0AAV6UB27_9ARAC|nr:hypothetical protein JTE90_013173 [Oedothorax gibbosus]